MKAPCKNCIDRSLGCHSTCERYIEFTKERQMILDNRKAINDNYSLGKVKSHTAKLGKSRRR